MGLMGNGKCGEAAGSERNMGYGVQEPRFETNLLYLLSLIFYFIIFKIRNKKNSYNKRVLIKFEQKFKLKLQQIMKMLSQIAIIYSIKFHYMCWTVSMKMTYLLFLTDNFWSVPSFLQYSVGPLGLVFND